MLFWLLSTSGMEKRPVFAAGRVTQSTLKSFSQRAAILPPPIETPSGGPLKATDRPKQSGIFSAFSIMVDVSG
jgi:hypothetical protein